MCPGTGLGLGERARWSPPLQLVTCSSEHCLQVVALSCCPADSLPKKSWQGAQSRKTERPHLALCAYFTPCRPRCFVAQPTAVNGGCGAEAIPEREGHACPRSRRRARISENKFQIQLILPLFHTHSQRAELEGACQRCACAWLSRARNKNIRHWHARAAYGQQSLHHAGRHA